MTDMPLATAAMTAQPAPAPDSEGLPNRRRYFDSRLKSTVVQVLQGDYYVSGDAGEVISTILGSCVAACIRDPITRCGGMNHFLLPEAKQDNEGVAGLALRYGSYSMEQLVNAILAQGGRRERLEVKVFGGANVVKGMSKIGCQNADFVERYLKREGFQIAGGHLRGLWPRKVLFYPATGQVRMRELKNDSAAKVFDKEVNLAPRPVPADDAGSIELFD
jgi:chemotaxis protein CheD